MCEEVVVPARRSVRRHHDNRAKENTRKFMRDIWKDKTIDPATIGKVATQHATCDCWMCKRKHEDKDISDLRKPQFIGGADE